MNVDVKFWESEVFSILFVLIFLVPGEKGGGGGKKYLALQRRLNNYSEKKDLKFWKKRKKSCFTNLYV